MPGGRPWPALAPPPLPGQAKREAAWLLWGASFFFRPAAIASAALQISAQREEQQARRASIRQLRRYAIGVSVAALGLSALIYLLR